ncbi:MAG TPA: carbon storage regulator CsrA [Fimbriiglobus sp.]|jgi:carbon storage regulator
MLVLTRKSNERIMIADNIRIQVLDISGGRVRLGIEAPADISVWREEVVVDREWDEYPADPVRKPR